MDISPGRMSAQRLPHEPRPDPRHPRRRGQRDGAVTGPVTAVLHGGPVAKTRGRRPRYTPPPSVGGGQTSPKERRGRWLPSPPLIKTRQPESACLTLSVQDWLNWSLENGIVTAGMTVQHAVTRIRRRGDLRAAPLPGDEAPFDEFDSAITIIGPATAHLGESDDRFRTAAPANRRHPVLIARYHLLRLQWGYVPYPLSAMAPSDHLPQWAGRGLCSPLQRLPEGT